MCISMLRYYWQPDIGLIDVEEKDTTALSMLDSIGELCLRKMDNDQGSASTFDGKEGRMINCVTSLKCGFFQIH